VSLVNVIFTGDQSRVRRLSVPQVSLLAKMRRELRIVWLLCRSTRISGADGESVYPLYDMCLLFSKSYGDRARLS